MDYIPPWSPEWGVARFFHKVGKVPKPQLPVHIISEFDLKNIGVDMEDTFFYFLHSVALPPLTLIIFFLVCWHAVTNLCPLT